MPENISLLMLRKIVTIGLEGRSREASAREIIIIDQLPYSNVEMELARRVDLLEKKNQSLEEKTEELQRSVSMLIARSTEGSKIDSLLTSVQFPL